MVLMQVSHRLGDRAAITSDTFPGRTYPGQVAFIASEAEFTPKNVQTRKERTRLVFAVKVSFPNPDGTLKPGMTLEVELPQ